MSVNFSQIPLSSADMKASVASVENLKKSENGESNLINGEIINKINAQNKDIKVAISKLLEQNKILQK